MKAFVRELLLENRGSFEDIWDHSIRKYRVSGTTVKRKLYEGDGKERYFHIFYSDQKAGVEHEQIEAKIDRMAKYLDEMKGKKLQSERDLNSIFI